jgi:hypothetical protein
VESLDTNYDFHESKNVDVGNMVVYKYMYILTCMHTSYISMEKNQIYSKVTFICKYKFDDVYKTDNKIYGAIVSW